jgi:hypothetical protein
MNERERLDWGRPKLSAAAAKLRAGSGMIVQSEIPVGILRLEKKGREGLKKSGNC